MTPALQIRDREGTVPPPGPHGLLQLDGRRRWLCAGHPELIARLVAGLPSGIATPLSRELAELWFGNTIGFVPLGAGLPTVEVVAGKWRAGTWRILTARLLEELRLLPFQSSGVGATPTVGDVPLEPVELYQAFLTLRHQLEPDGRKESEVLGAFRSILARPHQTPIRRNRQVPTSMARTVDVGGLIAIASGQLPMQRGGRPDRLRGFMPIEVCESVLDQSVDNPENRFALGLLREMSGITFRLREVALHHGDGSWLLRDLDRVDGQLEPIRRHSFWRRVGRTTGVPGHSTVLHGRSDYRTLFRAHGALRLGVRLPCAPDELQRMVAQRDIATLYELWCTFAVLGAVRIVLGPPTSVEAAAVDTLDTSLRQGLLATWADHGVRLSFNPSFTLGNADPERRSTSLLLRPDVLLETPHGRHALDAKFKLQWDGSPKSADLHKMHTYRDALPIDSAWVLYPGSEELAFPANDGDAVSGIGCVPTRVDRPNHQLIQLVSRMLRPPKNPRDSTAGSILTRIEHIQ